MNFHIYWIKNLCTLLFHFTENTLDLKRSKWLVQGQIAGKWQTWAANLNFLISNPVFLFLLLAPGSEFELAPERESQIQNPESWWGPVYLSD